MKPRNPMGIHVHKRKAGAHRKPFKSIRRKEKQSIGDQIEQCRKDVQSWPQWMQDAAYFMGV